MPGVGSTTRITCQSPTYGSFKFVAPGDADTIYNVGGRISKEDSKTTGDGKRIQAVETMGPYVKISEVGWDMAGRQDLENTAFLSGEVGGQTWTFYNEGSGVTYRFTNAFPVGKVEGSGYKGTFALSLEGEVLEQI